MLRPTAGDLLRLFSIVHAGRMFCGPLDVSVNILSGRCNGRCVMCKSYSSLLDRGERPARYLPLDSMKRLLADLERSGAACVTFCADGEPFLHPDVLPLLEHLRSTRLRYRFITNGTLMRDDHIRLMGRKAAVRLSIHAGSADLWSEITGHPRGLFPGLLENVRRLKEAGAKVIFHSVVSKKNAADLPQLVRCAGDCGADEVSIGPLTVFDEKMRELSLDADGFARFKSSIPAARKAAAALGLRTNLDCFLDLEYDEGSFSTGRAHAAMPCYVGWLFSWIDCDGNLTFCCNSRRPIGNIAGTGFGELWYGGGYNRLRNLAREKRLDGVDCRRCVNYIANSRVDRVLRFLPKRRLPRSA